MFVLLLRSGQRPDPKQYFGFKNIQDKKNGFTKNKWVTINILGLNQSLQCDCENEDRLDL